MSNRPLALVTGAYRGLGFETCRQLAHNGYQVILTARRESEGQAAADDLVGQGLEVIFHPLDITDGSSVEALAAFVRERFGRLDVLVNNAGVFPDPRPGSAGSSVFEADLDLVRQALEANTLGALRVCQALIPLMEGRGRVVNVSSGMAQLSEMNGGCTGYRLSKTALNAVTCMFADELQGTGVKINSVCPGWVRTEMGGMEAPIGVEEGARGIVWAATLPEDGPSGGFFRQGEPIPW
ncbi:short-chain dehydrogenase/reductase SDR [Thiorhodococcus drewsii AZ1]|uniref:Short-chain dehydrogenase/reductase SDR n=1 Tax=Thiorhodococcus drewsii AZ1 TaxID=765913 RepID=G2E059_9GAMM|nr:SDR family oxidoreductase [Thiorhodococcus drewsii]EGV31787.1 short-chain dehydrogenase/reductase SDR [Thiorhodococcus drewsii AZ1]